MTQALHHTLSAGPCAFSLPAKILFIAARPVLRAIGTSPARRTLSPLLNTDFPWPAKGRLYTWHSPDTSCYGVLVDVSNLDPPFTLCCFYRSR